MSEKLTIEKAKELLQDILKVGNLDEKLGINWNNLREIKGEKLTFRITANMISLTALIYMIEHESIDDVYFHPSIAPPREEALSTAMRYHLYIKFIV